MIDLAGDLAGVFDDPFGFAVDAVYTPSGGDPAAVRAILSRPDDTVVWRETALARPTCIVEIRVAEVPTPAAGDTLTVDGVTYRLQGRPERDTERVSWRIEAVET